jgi:cell division septation protein DedD
MEVERYSDPQSFAREVNLPLIGVVTVAPIPAGAPAATLLAADDPDEMKPVVDALTQTRKSLTLRSLFMTGFPHDPEFFAAGVALARQWSRQGLKVAVVDLDFRHPTIVRPLPSSNEGYVDALEYGCSFQRVAWELVADSLWLVGPGSHPPDEARFAQHPDWARVMRIFSARVDVTLYLAPFLDRKGFTGSLSKRMDGVLLAASVRRTGRVALRDAFLELWGSDAPMIGCLGISVPYDYAPRGEVELTLTPREPSPSEWTFPSPELPLPAQPPAPGPPSAPPGTSSASPGTPAAPRMSAPPAGAPTPDRRGQAAAPPAWTPARPQPAPAMRPGRESGEAPPQALVARLSDEVRRGHAPRNSGQPSRGVLVAALILVIIAGIGAFLAFQAMRRGGAGAKAPDETLPAGTERVLPADLGATSPNGLPGTEGTVAGSGDASEGEGIAPTDGTEGGDAGAGTTPPAREPAPQAAGSTPSAGTEEKREPAPGKGTARSLRSLDYRVHVASFRSESKVRDLVKQLRSRGEDAWYSLASDQPGWYRVYVGHYATREEAARKAAWLLERGWVERARAYPDNVR